MLRFDHVLMAVRDLDRAARRLEEEHGLASVTGGRHVGLGTANRIVPLGPDYLELIAVVDPQEAAGNPLGRFLRHAVADGDRLAMWCLQADDVDEVAARLGLEVLPIARARPDGVTLRWRLAGLEAALADPSVPFFLTAEFPPELHPGRMDAPHRVKPRGIAWVEVGADPERLRGWTGGQDVPVRLVDGPPGPRAVGVATAAGEVVLR